MSAELSAGAERREPRGAERREKSVIVLRYRTPLLWTATALSDFDAFLCDHAACERKASATAMSFVAHYADKPALVTEMIALAREELTHFSQVWDVMQSRGLALRADEKDEYVGAMRALVRKTPSDLYLLDRLLVAGVIEARGCERFGLVAEALADPSQKDFYTRLTLAEARHHMLFVDLAHGYFDAEVVEQRLGELLDREARIVADLPWRAALH